MSKQKNQEGELRSQDLPAPVDQSQDNPKEAPVETRKHHESADAQAVLESELEAAKTVIGDRDVKIMTLEAEVSSLKDQYLRKLADYENFRKRMFREKDDAVQYANTQLLTDLVGVVDNFDRAVQSSETSRDFQSLHDGVDMIRKSLLGLLESKYGLARFDSLGAKFDPNMHEAVMSDQGECEEPVVVEEFVRGYKLRDRVLRSAKVKVRMPLPTAASTESEETTRE
ncbi:MAG TPA: nucleotide exchange factor GrpE [bacterium]|nr:nucleotide exchange factor GrpE [bacterium]